jgi:hypothetical protein
MSTASAPVADARLMALEGRVKELEERERGVQRSIEEDEAAKKAKKAQIKQWMTDFEQREGRPPTNQDKEAIKVRRWILDATQKHHFSRDRMHRITVAADSRGQESPRGWQETNVPHTIQLHTL